MPDNRDDAVADLVQQLCVRAGVLMEDFSVDAVSILPRASSDGEAMLVRLKSATSDMAALVAAAEVLERRFVESDCSYSHVHWTSVPHQALV
jgi:hypothetical protein